MSEITSFVFDNEKEVYKLTWFNMGTQADETIYMVTDGIENAIQATELYYSSNENFGYITSVTMTNFAVVADRTA